MIEISAVGSKSAIVRRNGPPMQTRASRPSFLSFGVSLMLAADRLRQTGPRTSDSGPDVSRSVSPISSPAAPSRGRLHGNACHRIRSAMPRRPRASTMSWWHVDGALLTWFELEFSISACPEARHAESARLRRDRCRTVGPTRLAELNSSDGTPGCGALSKDLTDLKYSMRDGGPALVLVGSTAATDRRTVERRAHRLSASDQPARHGDLRRRSDEPPLLPRRRSACGVRDHERVRRRELLPEPGGDARRAGEVPGGRSRSPLGGLTRPVSGSRREAGGENSGGGNGASPDF